MGPKLKSWNPVKFTPLPVTIITTVVYVALFVALLVTHLVVPSAPSDPGKGIDLVEAWRDLQEISNGFHPYNSRRNDYVRNWLLRRIEAILDSNGVKHSSEPYNELHRAGAGESQVVIFNDMMSNVTFSSGGTKDSSGRGRQPGTSVYFEGTNIIVYIRGSADNKGDWWNKPHGRYDGLGGVLVNAHYDSVSTGYGATDDGVGLVTILQLIKYFTTSGHEPKRGIVALLNNGEEDSLNGARAFTQHPTSTFAHTFLNLEGAGAGGRATLFRSTDMEITRFYQRSQYPFGTVISGDAFSRGLIRSQTDYVVFNGLLGLRGLDVAFMEPRARYHTEQDDARHTSVDSLWHMLSAALATIQGLTADTSSTFDAQTVDKAKVDSGEGSEAVWFDLFGRGFAVFRLRTLFALSISLLVVTPILLIVVLVALHMFDKLYLFSGSKHHHHPEGDDTVALQGWRGFFRYPVIFIVASGTVVGLAFLVRKVNPFIVYSSQYAVWSMMLSAWLFVAWFFFRAIDFVRPTALHRAYSFLWMYIGGWMALVVATVFEQSQKLAGVYFIVFYFCGIFLATLISFAELFALPRKSEYAEIAERHQNRSIGSPRSGSISSSRLPAPLREEYVQESADQEETGDQEPTESTSLIRGGRHPTFAHYTGSGQDGEPDDHDNAVDSPDSRSASGDEQGWSASMPRWTWLLQFILLAPFVVILVGQLGLLLTSATHQTGADGNSVLLVYVAIAILSTLILLPLAPFLHRLTYHVPMFLLLVLVGTLIYNLVAFPFSNNNRLKYRFIQTIDLESGINEVTLDGIGAPFLRNTIKNVPSAAGQELNCARDPKGPLGKCSWNGLPPRVVANTHPNLPPELGYTDWLSFNVTRTEGKNEARFQIVGRNTRACKITFESPISDFSVNGVGHDSRFQSVPDGGSNEVRLWSRTWEKPWDVYIKWENHDGGSGMDGKVVCLWSDANETGVIPAFEEIQRFTPDWVVITKLRDGLVEGFWVRITDEALRNCNLSLRFSNQHNLHQTKFADRSPTTDLPAHTTKPCRQKSVTVASSTLADIPAAISSLYSSLHLLLPESLQLYIAQVAAHLPSTSQLLPNSTASHTLKHVENVSLTSPEVLTTAALTVILAIVSMTSWRSRFGGWGSRYSPAPAPSGPPPRVSDSDFSYLTTDDIVEPPRRTYDPYKPTFPRHSNVTRPHDPNLGPDIICLKHRGVTYPLHFPAFSIGDGDLTVGDLREKAARETGTDDQRRIKLLYKGRILKDDSKPCKAEGLKQQSEILCVISEAVPTNPGIDEDSESGADSLNGPTVEVDGTISAAGKKKRNHRGNKKKGRKGGNGNGSGSASPRAENLAPPSDPVSAGTSRPTTPAQPKTAIEKLDEIASTFHTKLVPQCIQYISNPPQDAKARDQEYKKLSETILAQVILKLDAVELGEDEAEARQRRRNLVKETQAMLGRLDVVHDGAS